MLKYGGRVPRLTELPGRAVHLNRASYSLNSILTPSLLGLEYKTVILYVNTNNVGGIRMKGLEGVYARKLYILPSR